MTSPTDREALSARLRDAAERFLAWAYKKPYHGSPVLSIPRSPGNVDCILIEAAAALGADRARIGELERELDEAIRRKEHTEYWYAVRLERIKDVAKRVGIWPEVAAIIANGSGTRQMEDGSFHYDPPTYAQQLNIAQHRAGAAEARAQTAESELSRTKGLLAEAVSVAMAEHAHWLKEASKHRRPSGAHSDCAMRDLERAKVAKRIADKLAATLTASEGDGNER